MRLRQSETNDKAIRLYHSIAAFIEANGRPPTVREVAGMLDVTSTSTAKHYLYVLKSWGWVDWSYHQVRTLRLTRVSENIIEVRHD